jgi:hypothetical protein
MNSALNYWCKIGPEFYHPNVITVFALPHQHNSSPVMIVNCDYLSQNHVRDVHGSQIVGHFLGTRKSHNLYW